MLVHEGKGQEMAMDRSIYIPVPKDFKRYKRNEPGKKKVPTIENLLEVNQVPTPPVAARGSEEQFEKEVADLGVWINRICAMTAYLKIDIMLARWV